MKIDIISDLHGFYPELSGGDLLIVAGDWTASDKSAEIIKFALWCSAQKYKRKVVIAGNHDNLIQRTPTILEGLPDCALTYLCDSGVEIDGIKLWGSPWSLTFEGINPKCKAFCLDSESDMYEKFKKIPEGIDILITHCPPFGVMDMNYEGERCGSSALRSELDRVKPAVHCFGHIHERGGSVCLYKHRGVDTFCINASHVNELYKPINKPVTIYKHKRFSLTNPESTPEEKDETS